MSKFSVELELLFLHPLPVYEPVQVIDQEHNEADQDGNVCDILHSGQRPQDDQHHIVGGIGQCKIRTPAEGQVHREAEIFFLAESLHDYGFLLFVV